MNFENEILLSIGVFLAYILVRSSIKQAKDGTSGIGTGILLIVVGLIIYIYLYKILGVLTILGGLVFFAIEGGREKEDEKI